MQNDENKNVSKSEVGKAATVAHNRAIPYSEVQRRIVCVRDKSVILDVDVAALYGVETKHVNQAVRNNRDKFPSDYVFELTSEEVEVLRSKILTARLSPKSRVTPKAFTEKGLYMLATILKSKQATAATLSSTPSAVFGKETPKKAGRNEIPRHEGLRLCEDECGMNLQNQGLGAMSSDSFWGAHSRFQCLKSEKEDK